MKQKIREYGYENDVNLKLVIALARSSSIGYRTTQKLVSNYGLTISQFGVLEALYHLGEMCINEIIEKTLSTSGNMTVIIRNLERDDFIKKVPGKEDKRRSVIHLAKKGSDVIEKIFPLHLMELSRNFSSITDTEKELLISLLKKLNGYRPSSTPTSSKTTIFPPSTS
jgi:MarR family 2-MHQ and catechol resistance regulon transcriptional repressor